MAEETRNAENTVLVLKGGGAFGVYQGGAYEALAAAELAAVWVKHAYAMPLTSPAVPPSATPILADLMLADPALGFGKVIYDRFKPGKDHAS